MKKNNGNMEYLNKGGRINK